MRKWSVKEFEGLIRHQLTDVSGPVELVDGEIVSLPNSEQIERQITLLTGQIERYLIEQGVDRLEARSHYPICVDDYSVLKPAISLIERTHTDVVLHWALDICEQPTDSDKRVLLYAHCQVQEYWSLCIEQVELRVKTALHNAAYQQQQLLMVGEQTYLQRLPQLHLRLKEPLPLYFLTRTLQGQRTYVGAGVPLQVVGWRQDY